MIKFNLYETDAAKYFKLLCMFLPLDVLRHFHCCGTEFDFEPGFQPR